MVEGGINEVIKRGIAYYGKSLTAYFSKHLQPLQEIQWNLDYNDKYARIFITLNIRLKSISHQ